MVSFVRPPVDFGTSEQGWGVLSEQERPSATTYASILSRGPCCTQGLERSGEMGHRRMEERRKSEWVVIWVPGTVPGNSHISLYFTESAFTHSSFGHSINIY
jgi:hypothetical protein